MRTHPTPPVPPTVPFEDGLLAPHQRRNFASGGLVLWGLLAVACILSPDPSGLGTHEQLGLPPCTFQMLFGIRCPTCGMTTSWSHFTRGELAAAWQANAGGVVLAVAAAVGGTWALAAAVRGIATPRIPQRIPLITVFAIAAITVIDWSWKLF